jgi:hypothetical protein
MPLLPEKISVALYRHEWHLVLAGLLALEKQVTFKQPDQIIVDIHLTQRAIEKVVKTAEAPVSMPQIKVPAQTPEPKAEFR